MKRRLIMFLASLLLTAGAALAQTAVTGVVISQDDGQPVIGATVRVVGTNTGVVTDAAGKFELTVPAGRTRIAVSYVGMESTEVAVKKQMRIYLNRDGKSLDEVIVVAYGTTKKSAFTGSAAEIKTQDISNHISTAATSALVGKVAGVQAVSSSGEPGSEPTIRIRGIGSMNASSNPLYIVDGAPYEFGISNINPNDIESISVLKDASASAIYGARGANGVVIITTKKAKVGEAKVTVDAKWGSNSRLIPQYDVITDPAQYYETHYRAMFNSKYYNGSSKGEAYAFADANLFEQNNGGLGYNIYSLPEGEKLIGTNFKMNPNAVMGRVVGDYYYTADNWYDETYHNSFRQEYNMTVSGANERINYYASAGYLNDGGQVDNSSYQRYTARTNIDYRAKDWLRLTTNMGFTHSDSETASWDEDNLNYGSSGNVFYITNNIAPIYPLYVRNADGTVRTENGRVIYDSNQTTYKRPNFVGNAVRDNQYNSKHAYSDIFNGKWMATVTPLEGLDLSAALSVTSYNQRYNALYSTFASGSSVDGQVYLRNRRYMTVNQQYLANFNRTFADVHTVGVLFGYEQFKYKRQYLSGSNDHLYAPTIGELDNAHGSSQKSLGSNTDNYMTEGFLGRVQYNYDEKYFASASFRRDASSVFAPGHRWGNFGSFGLAWQVNKESFMSDVKWVDLLKVKLSYGVQGNDNLSSLTYPWQAYSDMYEALYNEDTGEYNISMVQKGNDELTWETSKAWNFGVDFALFSNRLSGSIELYKRTTSDMLFNKPLPLSSGINVSSYPTNIGSMVNKGIEVVLDGTVLKTKDMEWSVNVNLTHNVNEITDLDPSVAKDGIKGGYYIRKIGGTIYQAYMKKYAGVNRETGKAQWYMDVEKTSVGADGNKTTYTVVELTEDITKATQYDCGTTLPDVIGGFGTSFRAYGFDLSAQFSFQLGGQIYDGAYQVLMHGGQSAGTAMHKDLLNAWSEDNKLSDIPRISTAAADDPGIASQTAQDRFLTSSNYLTLNNLTVGYTFPAKIVNPLKIADLRVFVSGENLFLLTKRKGLDPRYNFGIGSMTYGSGLASSSYAGMRTVTAGVSLTF